MENDTILQKINEIYELIDKFTKNYNKLLDLYIKHKVSQYDLMKYTINISKNAAPQRTDEWYRLRGTCITASDVGAFLGVDKYKSKKKAINMKAGIVESKFGNKFTKWGNKYEQIAALIYEKMHNVKIYDAPLLIHPIYPFIGASCDGFVVDEVNKDGYLIEIKCPLMRKLGDEVPEHYINQPRTQLEVVKADRCQFFECKLEEYPDEHSYRVDRNTEYKGMFISYGYFHKIDFNGMLEEFYMYPDNLLEEVSFEDLRQQLIKKEENVVNVRPIYWKLAEYKDHRVDRDPQWLEDSVPILEDCWNKIVELKSLFP